MPEQSIEKVESLPELPLPVASDLVVVARNPEEMVQAQNQLVSWAIQKVQAEESQVTEFEAQLALAVEMHHRRSGYQKQLNLARGRVTFYTKIRQALEAGYCIVPNFPIEVIAVRTKRSRPKHMEAKGRWAGLPAVAPDQLPAGEGTYVSPETKNGHRSYQIEKDGKTETKHITYPTDFRDVSFPARLARVEVLSNLSRAQKLRLFDDIGMLPAHRRSKDPMLIGRIHQRITPYQRNTLSFMIAWWIDTKML